MTMLIMANQRVETVCVQELTTSNHRILGINFFDGSARDAIEIMRSNGGLLDACR